MAQYNMMQRWEQSSPCNLFFNKILGGVHTYNCIEFSDLLCPSLGKLEKSLQFTYTLDLPWLFKQYQRHGLTELPITVLYDARHSIGGNQFDNLKIIPIKLDDTMFPCHHSKMGIYAYENGSLRIVVSTGNLDHTWDGQHQQLWVSPLCKKMEQGKEEEANGPTGFKRDLLFYLQSYNTRRLDDWIELVKNADFSSVKVHFVASIPGEKMDPNGAAIKQSHLYRVQNLLRQHVHLPNEESSWSIVAHTTTCQQYNDDWLHSKFKRSVTPTGSESIKYYIIFKGYRENDNDIEFCVWRLNRALGEVDATPHAKSYACFSSDYSKMAYFLLTSANISKAAWGTEDGRGVYVPSYEVGVMFLPAAFGITHGYFDINNANGFPLIYDLPPTGFQESMEMEVLYLMGWGSLNKSCVS